MTLNPYSIPSLLGFLVNGVLAVYVLSKDRKDPLNRQYFAVCLSFMAWALGDIFQDVFSGPAWGRLGNDLRIVGISSVAVHFLRFASVFTEKKKFLAGKISHWLAYVPPIIFVLLVRFTDLVMLRQPVRMYFGYYSQPTWGLIAFLLWVGICCSSAIYLCWKVYRKVGDWRKRRAALLFFIGSLITFVFGFGGDGILSAFNIVFPVEITIISSIFLVAFVGYAIVKYGFLTVSPKLAMETIFKTIPDFLVITDRDLKITLFNDSIVDILGYVKKELDGRPLVGLFSSPDPEKFVRDLREVPISDYSLELVAKNTEKIPVTLNSYPVRRGRDLLGVVVIAHDMRQTKEFVRRLEEARAGLEAKNGELEALNARVKEDYLRIGRINRLLVGRELKMAELKREIAELKAKG